jgi:hypothetical protein
LHHAAGFELSVGLFFREAVADEVVVVVVVLVVVGVVVVVVELVVVAMVVVFPNDIVANKEGSGVCL